MLLSYRKEIFRPECNSTFQSLHCIARLDQDIGEVLPYLNTTLGGFVYFKDPPGVTFRVHGKLITLHSRKIAINALKDEAEADKILEWLKREINETWDKRAEIEPSFQSTPRPQLLHILKLLPKTNCRQCGQPTCMVFSALAIQGVLGAGDCSPIDPLAKENLTAYLDRFHFDG